MSRIVMSTKNFSELSSRCFRDAPPPCLCACPLGVNVRELIEKMQRGNFTSAYRVYRNHVVFPGIISKLCPEPCMQACVRKGHDQSVYLKKLEAACVVLTRDREPVQYNVPAKPFTVAVIGGGLSGLTCALKLAARNYSVCLYEKEEAVGGGLLRMPERESFAEEIALQFSMVEYDLRLSSPVDSLEDIKADATYISTGSKGEDFGLLESVNRESLGTSLPGVFLGGGLLGADPLRAVEHGLRASHSIETYLKTGSMAGVPETYTKPTLDERYYSLPMKKQPPAVPEPEAFSKEEAIAESLRCLRCNCSLCRDTCEMMQNFNAYPPKITKDIMSSLNVIEGLTERVAQRLVNSCTQCGLCREVCPERVDMEICTLEARRELHKGGSLPGAFHDFWLRDMEHANDRGYLLYQPEGFPHSEYLFFPGCQLGASNPEYVLRTYAALRNVHADTALLLACCGVPADWAGGEELRDRVFQKLRSDWEKSGKPIVILGCPTCAKTFARYFSDIDQISLYEFLERLALPAAEPAEQSPVRIYDPCSSRGFPPMQSSVRSLARGAGLLLEAEEDEDAPQARCCSFGGQIEAAKPDLAEDIIRRRIQESEAEYVTYCVNCRDIFASAGKKVRHILDVLFTGNPGDRPPPSLSQRRVNRLQLKAAFMQSQESIEGLLDAAPAIRLEIPPELGSKMDRLRILDEEARETIHHCEESGAKLHMPASGQYAGHLRIGIITYWVLYRKQGDGFILDNIYMHRMKIEE